MTSLPDSIPDVETLLELQPEELAGAILLDLATNRRRVHPYGSPIHAAMKADELLEAGELDGCAVWKRILRAVEVLRRAEPKQGERLQ